MKLVVIESPLAGDFERNILYARYCMYDSLMRGEAPYASHLLYPQVLDDEDPVHRKTGMQAGFAWGQRADIRAFYTDLGESAGMYRALKLARTLGQPVSYRKLTDYHWSLFSAGILIGTATRGMK
jgi:hypothetical protein